MPHLEGSRHLSEDKHALVITIHLPQDQTMTFHFHRDPIGETLLKASASISKKLNTFK